MRRFTRCMCLLIVGVLMLSTTAFASENIDPRASYYFSRYRAFLSQTSDKTFDIWFDVTATGGMDELGVSVIKVQRSSDDTNWTTMKTYYKENFAQMIDEGSSSHAGSVSYTGSRGYYYRARVEFYAKDSSGSSTLVYYTSSIYLPSN